MHTRPVELPSSNVTAVAGAGPHATYDAGGTLYSCGSGHNGELGDGSMHGSNTPVQVHGLYGGSATALVAAYSTAGALLSNGQYFDWGLNNVGQMVRGPPAAGPTCRSTSSSPLR